MSFRPARQLVGRDVELATLSTALDSLSSARGQAVILAGEAGIGKSALAASLGDLAVDRGASVFVGRAVAGPSAVPLRPLTEVLLAATRAPALPDIPALRPFQQVLQRLLLDHGTPGENLSPIILGEALLRTLSALGGSAGSVLVVEDLHWADPDTLAVLEYLADHVSAAPLLLVATVRTTGYDEPAEVVRTLSSRSAARLLPLERLAVADVAHLVEERLGGRAGDSLVRVVVERSEGVPFVVEELLAAGSELAETVPASLAAAVDERLARLPHLTQRILEVAAVLGRTFDVELAAAVAGRPMGQIRDDLGLAVWAQILEPPAAGVARFRHALTREAVLARLLPSEQAEIARLSAEHVEHGESLDAIAHELAAQLFQIARKPNAAARHLLAAGRAALRGGALPTATATLEHARILDPADASLRADVDEALVQALAQAARTDEALAVGARLLATLRDAGASPERFAAVHLLLASAAETATRWTLARDHLAQARRFADAGVDPVIRARVDVLDCRVTMTAGDLDRALQLATAALGAAERLALPEVAAEALEVIGRRERLCDLEQARVAFERQLSVAEQHDLQLHRVRALHELGTIDMLTTSQPQRLEEARGLAEQAGALALTATIDLQLVGLYAFRFEPDEAFAASARCLDLARTLSLDHLLLMSLLQTAFAHAVAGNGTEMESLLEEVAQRSDEPEVVALAMGHCRATLSLLQERREDALDQLDAAMAAVERMRGVPPGMFTGLWALLATVTDRDGRAARARVTSSDLAGHVLVGEAVQLAEAVAVGRSGRFEQAQQRAAEADASLRRHDLPHVRALLFRLVAEDALANGWGEPVAWLRETLSVFDTTPHIALREACHALLRQAGAPVPRRRGGVPDPLARFGITRRELDVLTLVGGHLTNAEIAQRLFVSRRTVEKHVERLLQKTGSGDRRALAALAHVAGVALDT